MGVTGKSSNLSQTEGLFFWGAQAAAHVAATPLLEQRKGSFGTHLKPGPAAFQPDIRDPDRASAHGPTPERGLRKGRQTI